MTPLVTQDNPRPYAYGVLYKPTNTGPGDVDVSLDKLLTPNVSFVRIQWIDLINTVRFRVLPASYFRKLLSNPSSRPGISLTKVTLGMAGLMVAPGFGDGVGEDLYVPDLSSWRVCTYAPGHASVMGWFQEKTSNPTHGLTVPFCPRTLLQRLVQEAHDGPGVSFLVGVESEFILMSQTSPEPVCVNHADWSCSAKTRTGSVESRVLEEIASCLINAGIELQMYHGEGAPGQYEVITGPLAPLEAADALVFTRETIYNIAFKHGLKATFAPRLHNDSCGSGAHTHISVHGSSTPEQTTANPDGSPNPTTMTALERSFLQGLLTHLPAICALTLPTTASYARMLDGIWSGGTYAAWGTDNRETPVRLCGAPGHHHFEVRCVDATATPHVAIAAIVAGGLRGVRDAVVLRSGDCTRPAFAMSAEERRAVIGGGEEEPVRLPLTVADARRALREDAVLGGMLGEVFVERYLAVNEVLEKYMTGSDEKETVQKLIDYY